MQSKPQRSFTSKVRVSGALFGLLLLSYSPSLQARSQSYLPSFNKDTQDYLCGQVRLNWRGLSDQCFLGLSQLIQESGLNPHARSGVGAEGLGQFMPGTWADMARQLKFDPSTPRYDVKIGIEAFTYYQGKLDYMWRNNRTPLEAHKPGLASYNGGPGSVIKAQKICNNAIPWDGIAPCVIQVTGPANSKQTLDYVTKIFARWMVLQAQ